jgi:hypothetical protein
VNHAEWPSAAESQGLHSVRSFLLLEGVPTNLILYCKKIFRIHHLINFHILVVWP